MSSMVFKNKKNCNCNLFIFSFVVKNSEKQFENSESFQKHIKEEKHSNVSKDAAFFNGDQ